MSKQAWRYQTLPANTAKVKRFCQRYSFNVKELNNGYQLRVEDVLDIYPVRGKYHNLTTHERGEWSTEDDLRKLMLKSLPKFDKVLTTKPEAFYGVGQIPQAVNVLGTPKLTLWGKLKKLIRSKSWKSF